MKNPILGNKARLYGAMFVALFAFLPLAASAQAAEETATSTTSTETVVEETAENGIAESADEPRTETEEIYERARVESVKIGSRPTDVGGEQVEVYEIRFISGPLKGEMREIQSSVSTNPYQLEPKTGDKIVVFMQRSPASEEWSLYIEGFDRRAALIWLFAVFVLFMVLLSGWQGVKTAFSIALSIAVIGFVLIPLFLKGVNPVPTAIVLMGTLTLLSTGFTVGWNKEAFVTALGTMGGALAAYLIATLFVDWAHLSGISTEEDRMFFRDNPGLKPQGLLFAGIIIAAAGAAEDVAVSIASAAREVKRNNPRASFKEVFESAMIVGKDHMSALANTLIFAYVGASLSALLLYTQFGGSWLKFINFDIVVDEVIRALTGTIGITLTVPITALLAAWVVCRAKIGIKKRR